MFEQRLNDSSVSSLKQDDARNSIEVIRCLMGMTNQLGGYNFAIAPRQQSKVVIEGLEISIRADLLVSGASRLGKPLHGAAVLRMTQGAETEAGKAKRQTMGQYVAALTRHHAEKHLFGKSDEIASKLCMSIDIQHGEVFTAPTSTTRMMNDVASACQFIVALWPSV
ncbi:hypothetical protein [Asaia bogorensis]|uniref:hypothetical protein n=1 Tax=Asaia bogorensis TaxID=91915 RepID=UPI001F11CCF0|nr:hypothetical protein [Asaia bogorensis]